MVAEIFLFYLNRKFPSKARKLSFIFRVAEITILRSR